MHVVLWHNEPWIVCHMKNQIRGCCYTCMLLFVNPYLSSFYLTSSHHLVAILPPPANPKQLLVSTPLHSHFHEKNVQISKTTRQIWIPYIDPTCFAINWRWISLAWKASELISASSHANCSLWGEGGFDIRGSRFRYEGGRNFVWGLMKTFTWKEGDAPLGLAQLWLFNNKI